MGPPIQQLVNARAVTPGQPFLMGSILLVVVICNFPPPSRCVWPTRCSPGDGGKSAGRVYVSEILLPRSLEPPTRTRTSITISILVVIRDIRQDLVVGDPLVLLPYTFRLRGLSSGPPSLPTIEIPKALDSPTQVHDAPKYVCPK